MAFMEDLRSQASMARAAEYDRAMVAAGQGNNDKRTVAVAPALSARDPVGMKREQLNEFCKEKHAVISAPRQRSRFHRLTGLTLASSHEQQRCEIVTSMRVHRHARLDNHSIPL